MSRSRRGPASRTFLFIAGLLVTPLAFAWSCGSPPLAPVPGAPEALGLDFTALPVGQLNVAGGNFLLGRSDLSIDTRLGTQIFGATWNSADSAWRWSTDLFYDGSLFVDGSGASHRLTGLQVGEAIPGTRWRVVDASRLQTKGGLVHRFGGDGLLEEVHWSGGAYPALRFLYTAPTGSRRLVSVEQCTADTACTPVFALAYDGAGRLARVTDRAGRVADYAYDAAGQLVSARDAVATAGAGPGVRYEYAGGQLSAVTNGDGERIALTYAGRRLASLTQVGAEDPTWRMAYGSADPDGHYVTQLTDPLGHLTRFLYDARGHLLERTHPSGEVERWTWSGGRVVSFTGASGATTTIHYADDDPVRIALPSGNILDIAYRPDAENRLASSRTAPDTIADSLGTILQASYDGAGRLVAVSNGAGEIRQLAYDALGELASVTAPNGITITYGGYGDHGHATTVTSPFGTGSRVYDAVGNPLQGSAQQPDGGSVAGGVVSRSFDADRRVVQVVLADRPAIGAVSSTMTLTVDRRADGRPLAIHRPYGGDTEILYDAIGRAVAQRELVDGAWQTTTTTPDALGRPLSVVRPNGMRIDRTWDGDGRLASLTRSRGGSLEASATYGYSGGRLASILDSVSGGMERYARDASGRPTAIHYPSGETLEIRYDLRERDIQETYWMQGAPTPLRTLAFVYDGANRLLSALDEGTPVVTRTYAQGRISRIDYGNGLTRSFGYDPRSGYVNAARTQDLNGGTIESSQLTWQSIYGLLSVDFSEELPSFSSSGTYEVGPSVTQTAIGGARVVSDQEDLEIRYDTLSNLTERVTPSSSIALSYNRERNRLLAMQDAAGNSIHTYAYDAAGFATRRDGVPLTWTADGRISSIGAGFHVEWDLEGRLVSVSFLGQKTRFLFGARVAADGAGAPQKLLLREVEIDLGTGQRRYRHFDFRGNVAFATDSAGSVVQAYDYAAYGPRALFGAVGGARSFAGGRLLGDMIWIGGRLYDPDAARFLAPDPLFQLVNQFAYAMGNPVQFWDPDGTSALGTIAMAAGVVTAAGSLAAVVVASAIAVPVGLAVAAVTLSIDVGLADSYLDPANAASPAARGVEEVVAVAVAPFSPALAAGVGGLLAGQALGTALTAPGGPPGKLGAPGPTTQVKTVTVVPIPPGSPPPTGVGPGAGGGGGGPSGFGGGGGGGGGCTVAALANPGPSLGWLWLLGPLQVGLGAWLLRMKHATGSGAAGKE